MTTVLEITQASARDAKADAIIIGVLQGPDGPVLAPGAEDVDAALGGSLAATLAALDAKGAPDEVSKIASGGALAVPLVVAVGLGTISGQQPVDLEVLRRAAGAGVRAATTARHIAIALPTRDTAETEAVALGALLGGYKFTKYKASGPAAPAQITVHGGDEAAADRARILAAAVSLTRDLVNTSPSDLYPETFAAAAERVAADGGLDIEVLDEDALAAGGYGGLCGVGRGSARPPRLVRLSHSSPDATKTVVFVGKGITFDSGGISLKPAGGMDAMKADMAGAGAVLGAMHAIAALAPRINVIGYLAVAENMPGGGAQRPSDVISIYGGKTVEVLNTDAEGRLVLADGLARSAEDSPDLVIDIATLTGAQVTALGLRIGGVMSNDPHVATAVSDSASQAGEETWPMPLPDQLRKSFDSHVADIANIPAERSAGMLAAGVFLREFVPSGVRWAHIDIAGPGNNVGEAHGYTTKGGTGYGVRTLVQVVLDEADGHQ